MEIKAILADNKNLLIVDVTTKTYPLKYDTINSIVLYVMSSKIPFTVELDVLEYMNTVRQEREMIRITSGTLGLFPGMDIPDGVYHLKFLINNVETVEETLVVTTAIDASIVELTKDLDYDTILNNVYLNKELENEAKQLLYVVALYNKMLVDVSINTDEVSINNTLDKFNRILAIWQK